MDVGVERPVLKHCHQDLVHETVVTETKSVFLRHFSRSSVQWGDENCLRYNVLSQVPIFFFFFPFGNNRVKGE